MSLSVDDKAFLAAILENPRDHAALLVYADWLEERGDARAAYLRNQVEFRKSRTEELRRRLIQLYPSKFDFCPFERVKPWEQGHAAARRGKAG